MKVYNKISSVYDLMVDWDARLKNEEEFFLHLFREQLTRSILDLGCGTGGHSLHWAEMGYNVVGIDSAKEMVSIAEKKAEEAEVDIEFQCLKMTDFSSKLQQKFDMIVCLGNTLPHLLDEFNLDRAFQEIAASLKPTGMVVFQLLNYQRILELRLKDLPVKSKMAEGMEYLFLRFYNFIDPLIDFNYIVAVKEESQWSSRSHQMRLRPWLYTDITDAANKAGFTNVMHYGGFDFCEFDPAKSENVIIVCDFSEE